MLTVNFTRATTRLLLAAALLVTASGAGAAASASSRAECPMSRTHACCKLARQKRRAPGAKPVRPCCAENSPLPAPANSNFTFHSSPGAAAAPRPSAGHAPASAAAAQPREYSPPFTPSHSPPAYLRHAAFLI